LNLFTSYCKNYIAKKILNSSIPQKENKLLNFFIKLFGIFSTISILPQIAFSICEHEERRYNKFKQRSENWGIASLATTGAGSFLGGFGGLLGAGPGAIAYRYAKMAEDALMDYRSCIETETISAAQKALEEERLERQRREEEEKRARDDLGSIRI
jgi:hypothetical protein